jgi:hypothetical protein
MRIINISETPPPSPTLSVVTSKTARITEEMHSTKIYASLLSVQVFGGGSTFFSPLNASI